MRRDVFINNDSGGFSVLAADAVDAIIEDGRSGDIGFVAGHKAMLLELYGDDAMPVRIVVDIRGDAEREAFDQTVEDYVFKEESVQWSGDTARLSEPDERTLLLLAGPVFRVRFGGQWPCDPIEEDE